MCIIVTRLMCIFIGYKSETIERVIPCVNDVVHRGDIHIMIPIEDRNDLDIEDRHNVHNICLKRSASHIIQKLKKSDQHLYTIEETFQQIYQSIADNHDIMNEQLTSAMQTFNQIDNMNALYQSGHIYEKEIIRLVWDRIHHPINNNHTLSLKNTLIQQLADCRNGYSGVHCCEGRIMRILQTLEHTDCENIAQLRPMWAYKEEIIHQITKYRHKLLSQLSPIYQQLDEKLELTENEKKIMDQMNRCLIKNLSQRFEIDYISKGLLTQQELGELTKVYYDLLRLNFTKNDISVLILSTHFFNESI